MTCEQFGHEWSTHCRESNALCAYMYGWRSFLDPNIKGTDVERTRDRWMRRAAKMGLAEAEFKIARNELGTGNTSAVRFWLDRSIRGGEADAAYQLGHLILENAEDEDDRLDEAQRKAVRLFRLAASKGASVYGGTRFAFYNMGVIKLFGLGDEERDADEAAEWFLRSEMPEGIYNYAIWLESKGEHKLALRFKRRAKRMGFGDSRRIMKRDQAKFGLYNKWNVPLYLGGIALSSWRKGNGVEWSA